MSSADSYANQIEWTNSGLVRTTSRTIDIVWLDVSGRIFTECWFGVWVKYILTEVLGYHSAHLTGESRLLAVGVAMGNCPAEVLWDRLMEAPYEITDCQYPELIPQIIDRLREQYRPN